MRPQTSATNQFAELAPIAPVEYLHAAVTLAGNHDLGVAIAELYLPKRPASRVKLAQHYCRTSLSASRRPARARKAASSDG